MGSGCNENWKLIRDLKCDLWKGNSDSSNDKSTTGNLYKAAFGDSIKSKSNTQDTLYTSTLAKLFQSTTGDVDLDFNKIDITKDISTNFFKLLVLNFFSSCDFADETIQLRFSIMTTSKTEGPNGIMTPHNLFATLKYAVVAVLFFR